MSKMMSTEMNLERPAMFLFVPLTTVNMPYTAHTSVPTNNSSTANSSTLQSEAQ